MFLERIGCGDCEWLGSTVMATSSLITQDTCGPMESVYVYLGITFGYNNCHDFYHFTSGGNLKPLGSPQFLSKRRALKYKQRSRKNVSKLVKPRKPILMKWRIRCKFVFRFKFSQKRINSHGCYDWEKKGPETIHVLISHRLIRKDLIDFHKYIMWCNKCDKRSMESILQWMVCILLLHRGLPCKSHWVLLDHELAHPHSQWGEL